MKALGAPWRSPACSASLPPVVEANPLVTEVEKARRLAVNEALLLHNSIDDRSHICGVDDTCDVVPRSVAHWRCPRKAIVETRRAADQKQEKAHRTCVDLAR